MADEIRLASRRERHKDQRRNRIIDAAYELMREAGADDISVKMISDRADVSTATLYNLFGTKGAVLEKVYERDMAQFAVKLAAAKAPSALDEIFEAVRTGIDLFRTDPNFYRGLSIRNPRAEPELVASVQDPRQQLWIGLLERAIAERDLAADTRVELVSMAMLHLGGGAFSAWCADLMTLDELELHTIYGLARLLLGVARPAGRAKLAARIAEIEAKVSPDRLQSAAGAR